ncbi:MAG: efflux RND transporter periplasmic adaptor subunit [Arenimonas sp.]
MRRVFPVVVFLAALLLVFFAFRQFFPSRDAAAQGGPGGPGGPGGGMPPSQVETVVVHRQALPSSFETVGTLSANQSVSLRPEVSGQLKALGFTEGQAVSRGQVLFRLDDALVRADLNEANANLQNSKRAYARASELAGKQLIARADLDKAQATLAVDQARAGSAATRVDKALIRAPFSGVTGLRKVNVGDYVVAGQELVDLVGLDQLELDLRAPEVVLSSLAVGQRVDFGVDSFRDEMFTAQLVAIAPTVDAGGRSASLRARIDNPERKLRPGMSARVRIVLATNAQALLVPEQAIVPMGEQKNVYVVVAGKAKLLPVTIGLRQPGTVEITSGLKDGDQVIVSGVQKIGDGAPVAAKPMAVAPAAAKASLAR